MKMRLNKGVNSHRSGKRKMQGQRAGRELAHVVGVEVGLVL
jgi:hypothetical protein